MDKKFPYVIHEIRRKRLREWIDTDPVSQGVVEAWCDYYSQFADRPINPVHIRQIVPKRGTPTSNLGETRARSLEKAGGKTSGWLDLDTTDPQNSQEDDTRAHTALYRRNPLAIAYAIEQLLRSHGLTINAIGFQSIEDLSTNISKSIFTPTE